MLLILLSPFDLSTPCDPSTSSGTASAGTTGRGRELAPDLIRGKSSRRNLAGGGKPEPLPSRFIGVSQPFGSRAARRRSRSMRATANRRRPSSTSCSVRNTAWRASTSSTTVARPAASLSRINLAAVRASSTVCLKSCTANARLAISSHCARASVSTHSCSAANSQRAGPRQIHRRSPGECA